MSSMPLTKLRLNQTGIIKEINCKASVKRRLLDLGLIPNTDITPILESIAGDPVAYEVRNIILAIRKEDADKIIVFAK
jgi:ferrous iron transport protein A